MKVSVLLHTHLILSQLFLQVSCLLAVVRGLFHCCSDALQSLLSLHLQASKQTFCSISLLSLLPLWIYRTMQDIRQYRGIQPCMPLPCLCQVQAIENCCEMVSAYLTCSQLYALLLCILGQSINSSSSACKFVQPALQAAFCQCRVAMLTKTWENGLLSDSQHLRFQSNSSTSCALDHQHNH